VPKVEEDETTDEVEEVDDGSGDGSGDDGGDDDGMGAKIKAAVSEALAPFFAADDDGEDVNDSAHPARTQYAQEIDFEAKARAALDKIGKEKETDARLAKVEQIVERPPRKQSKLERALWGTEKADA